MATAPSTTTYFTAPYSFPAPIPTPAMTCPHPPCGGYYPPPFPYATCLVGAPAPSPYPGGYCSAPPAYPCATTYPHPPPTSAYGPPAYTPAPVFAAATFPNPHPTSAYAPALTFPFPISKQIDPATSPPASPPAAAYEPPAGYFPAQNRGHTPVTKMQMDSAPVPLTNPASFRPLQDSKLGNLQRHAATAEFPVEASQCTFDSLQDELSKLRYIMSSLAASRVSSSASSTTTARSTTKVASTPSIFYNTSAAASNLSSPFGTSCVVPTSILASVCARNEATSASPVPSVTASVAPQMFDKMPAQKSCQETHGTTSNCRSGQHNPSQKSFVNTNLCEQNLDGRPQEYGFHNLIRQSVFREDGSEQRYFTLPADYPLERVVPEPVFDVHDDKTEDYSNVFVDALASIHEQSNAFADVLASTPDQQPYEEEQEDSELPKCFSRPNFSPVIPLVATVDIFILKNELTLEVSEYSVQMPQQANKHCHMLMTEAGRKEWDPGVLQEQLQKVHTQEYSLLLTEREVWDPGVSTLLHSSKFGVYVQRPRDPSWNVMLLPERRKEWDPGVLKMRQSYTATPHIVAHPGILSIMDMMLGNSIRPNLGISSCSLAD